ncbi:MAG: hypothetical protein KKA60_11280, partial [Proteobacteria bacterium]|nr:hypothetical protein [Pseudomonadota bacterium]
MSDILQTILEHKKDEVAAAQAKVPVTELMARAKDREPPRGFARALAAPGPYGANIIAEIKRASPSAGAIADLDPARQAAAYEEGGATALSVLTDARFFSGSLDDLKAARAACSLPALRKDFVVSGYQLWEAAAAGADAVLLIVRALSDDFLEDALAWCEAYGMDALVEVHDETTITGVISLEDLGFVEKGKGASYVADGCTMREGEVPTNTFGGL